MTTNGTIAIDFDGVIHSYTSGWKGAHVIPDPPVPGAFQFVMECVNKGFDVAIYSARARKWRGRRAMRRWIRNWAGNCWFDAPGHEGLEGRVRITKHKPPAFVYIDDRAWRFEGEWPNPSEVAAMKPWFFKPGGGSGP